MKVRLIYSLGFLLLVQVSCASFTEAYRNDYCNYNGAFGMGINDGKAGSDFRIDVARVCDSLDKDSVEQAYRDGYEIGLRKAPNRVNVNNSNNLNCDEKTGDCWAK